MGRPKRGADGSLIYHVLNRGNAPMTNFHKDGGFEAFERILEGAVESFGSQLLVWCLMPNHWHLLVKPNEDGELSRFVGWFTLTHTQRWHAHYHNTGSGHLYQGRFKSFPVQDEDLFLTVCRYVERNALLANVVGRAEDWRWSSLLALATRNRSGETFVVNMSVSEKLSGTCQEPFRAWAPKPDTYYSKDTGCCTMAFFTQWMVQTGRPLSS